MKKLKRRPGKIDHIGIDRIIFDSSEWATLWGFRLEKGQKIRLDYIISFEQLNKLLRLSGKEGDQVQMLIVEKLEQLGETPSIIELDEYFGHPVFFNRCLLEVSPTWSETEHGRYIEDPQCMSIDAVYPLVEKRKKTLSEPAICRQGLEDCEKQLADSYALYLGYLELDMKETEALAMADLEDDLKFKMAYLAWKMDTKAA